MPLERGGNFLNNADFYSRRLVGQHGGGKAVIQIIYTFRESQ